MSAEGYMQLCLLSEQLRTSVAMTKLTSIHWSFSLQQGFYADLLRASILA